MKDKCKKIQDSKLPKVDKEKLLASAANKKTIVENNSIVKKNGKENNRDTR